MGSDPYAGDVWAWDIAPKSGRYYKWHVSKAPLNKDDGNLGLISRNYKCTYAEVVQGLVWRDNGTYADVVQGIRYEGKSQQAKNSNVNVPPNKLPYGERFIVKHHLDAMVIFNSSHVVPLFVA